MELRCTSGRLHGIGEGDLVEVSCNSRKCGKAPGVIVLHKFNIHSGELVSTKLFRRPVQEKESADRIARSALRSA